MATNLDIITRALRKLRIVKGGGVPSADQASDGMQSLQSLIAELIGTGGLGRLYDVIATADYTAREFDRIRCDEVITVTLPLIITPQLYSCCDYGWIEWYGWLRCAKPRPPFDRAPVVVIDNTGVPTTNLYNAYQGKWVTINSLGQQDDFPLADYLEDGFAAMLAEAISPEYGQMQVVPIITRQANRCRYMLSYRLDSKRRENADCGNYF